MTMKKILGLIMFIQALAFQAIAQVPQDELNSIDEFVEQKIEDDLLRDSLREKLRQARNDYSLLKEDPSNRIVFRQFKKKVKELRKSNVPVDLKVALAQ